MKLSETRDSEGNIVPAKLAQFIAEHEGERGDLDAFNRTVKAMAGKSKEVPAASPPDDCDG